MFSFFKFKKKSIEPHLYKSTDFHKKSIQVTKNDCISFLKEYHNICDRNGFKSHILDFDRGTADYMKMLFSFKTHLDQLIQVYSVEEVCDRLCTKTHSLLTAVNEIEHYIKYSDNPLCNFIRNSEIMDQITKANPVIQYKEFKGHEVDIPDELMSLFILITYKRIKIIISIRYQISSDLFITN